MGISTRRTSLSLSMLDDSQAILYGKSYTATDLALDLLASNFSISAISGTEPQNQIINQSGSWLQGISLPGQFNDSENVQPLTATPTIEPSVLRFSKLVTQSGAYDVWVLASKMPNAGTLSLSIDRNATSVVTPDSSNYSMRWINLGSSELAPGQYSFSMTASSGYVSSAKFY